MKTQRIAVGWDGIALLTENPRALARGRLAGKYLRVHPGYYLERRTWSQLAPWVRFGLVVVAVWSSRRGAVLLGRAAAFIHGVPMLELPSAIDVQGKADGVAHQYPPRTDFVDDGVARRRWGVHVWPGHIAGEIVRGIRVQPLVDALIPLVSSYNLQEAVIAMDAFRARRVQNGDDDSRLPGNWLQNASKSSMTRIKRAWRLSNALSESAGESLTRVLIHLLGFVAPDIQVEISTRGGTYRVDFCWPALRIVLEFDGEGKYGSTPEEQLASRLAERRREEDLKAAGYHVFRLRWSDLQDVSQLREVLSANGVPHEVRPGSVAA